MKYFRQNCYSEETRRMIVPDETTIYLISTELTPVKKWDNHKPTDQIASYRAYFTSPEIQNGVPFSVKFSNEIKLPSYLSKVTLTDFVACLIGDNVYFKASDVKEKK